LLVQDLKNLSNNKEVSETIRKLATKMFKQKMAEASKKWLRRNLGRLATLRSHHRNPRAFENHCGCRALLQAATPQPRRVRLHAKPRLPHHSGESEHRRMPGRKSLPIAAGSPRTDRHRQYLPPLRVC